MIVRALRGEHIPRGRRRRGLRCTHQKLCPHFVRAADSIVLLQIGLQGSSRRTAVTIYRYRKAERGVVGTAAAAVGLRTRKDALGQL